MEVTNQLDYVYGVHFGAWKKWCCFLHVSRDFQSENVREFRIKARSVFSNQIWIKITLVVVRIAAVRKWNARWVALKDSCSVVLGNSQPPTLNLTGSISKGNREIKTHLLKQPFHFSLLLQAFYSRNKRGPDLGRDLVLSGVPGELPS